MHPNEWARLRDRLVNPAAAKMAPGFACFPSVDPAIDHFQVRISCERRGCSARDLSSDLSVPCDFDLHRYTGSAEHLSGNVIRDDLLFPGGSDEQVMLVLLQMRTAGSDLHDVIA